jgi:hypothetical protein
MMQKAAPTWSGMLFPEWWRERGGRNGLTLEQVKLMPASAFVLFPEPIAYVEQFITRTTVADVAEAHQLEGYDPETEEVSR